MKIKDIGAQIKKWLKICWRYVCEIKNIKQHTVHFYRKAKNNFVPFYKKYTDINTWKDSLIPENPEYNRRLKLFFIMVIAAVLAIIASLMLLLFFVSHISSPRIRMPELVRKDVVDAIRLVQAEELILNFENRYDDNFPRYTVVEQYPSAGLSLRKGRKVTLVVSMGQDLYTVPDLDGLSQKEATNLLYQEGIPYQIVVVPAGNNPTDVVIGQNYEVNTKIPREKILIVTITQNVRRGEYALEDFTRQNLEFALIRLLNNGIKPIIVRSNITSSSEDGIVLSQSIASDTVMKSRSSITLTVGVFARDQGERNRLKWGYIRYTFPQSGNEAIQEVSVGEDGSNIVTVSGKVGVAQFYRVFVIDELGRRNTIYERNGGEGSTIIRAFKYYGQSTLFVTADGIEIASFPYE